MNEAERMPFEILKDAIEVANVILKDVCDNYNKGKIIDEKLF